MIGPRQPLSRATLWTGRHHADDYLVESEYRSVFLKLFPRYAGRARRGATAASDNLRGTAVVVENAPKSLSRHDGASVIRACRQRCEELVAETFLQALARLAKPLEMAIAKTLYSAVDGCLGH